MTVMDKARAALEQYGVSVNDLVCTDDPLPDAYIVLTPTDQRPVGYAGDEDGAQQVYLRAAWYSRTGYRGLAKKMRDALRAAGFLIDGTQHGYDDKTGHYIAYQDAAMLADYESED